MEKKIISTKKGFSLVEVVAALAIMSILFVGVFQLISTANKAENSTNEKIINVSVLRSACNILFSLNDDEIQFFKNKTIRFEVNGPGDVSDIIIDKFKEPKVCLSDLKGDFNSSYYLEGSSNENPIKFIVYVTVDEIKKDPNNKENILYKAKVSVISLNKNQQYYYVGKEKEGNGKDFDLGINAKNINKNQTNIILRPLD